jgi:hypothetical protein
MSTFDIRISKVLRPTGLSAAGVEPNAYAAQRHPSRENRMNLAKIPRRGYLQGATPIEPLKNFSVVLSGKGSSRDAKTCFFFTPVGHRRFMPTWKVS